MFDAKNFIKTLPQRPGVYCMRDSTQQVLYVGKAKNLKNRVSSYFHKQYDTKTIQLVNKISHIDITITNSEKEALLLESSLIKSLKPRFNIIFKDDKSYPYLFLSKHDFPRLVYFRGKQTAEGQYFGPYPSAYAVKEALVLLQKLFKLRQCDDQFFQHRSRPCLQYQINRCTAPCVNYINKEDYAKDVKNSVLFLQGKESSIIESLIRQMDEAALAQDFEKAAQLRDQIARLHQVHEQQVVYQKEGNVDVIAAVEKHGLFCVQLINIRLGQMLESQSFFPKQTGNDDTKTLLRSFLLQFYCDEQKKRDYPNEILVNESIEDQSLMSEAISQFAQHKVKILQPQRHAKAKWLALAVENAEQSLNRRQSQQGIYQQRWQSLMQLLKMNSLTRIECFDISHLHSEATTGSCVVFNQEGALKSEYRHYRLNVPPADDYAAMEQILSLRFTKRKTLDLPLPEILMVDGGKGQLHKAKKVMLECQILDVWLIGIAKGLGRKPGLETLYITQVQEGEEFEVKLPATSPILHLLQKIRDEAHRFAIRAVRQKVRQSRKHSVLENIPGIGVKRRQQLLSHFGGLQALLAASVDAIAQVPGISKALAIKIFDALHPS